MFPKIYEQKNNCRKRWKSEDFISFGCHNVIIYWNWLFPHTHINFIISALIWQQWFFCASKDFKDISKTNASRTLGTPCSTVYCIEIIRTVPAKLTQTIGRHSSEMDEWINVNFWYVIAILSSYLHIKLRTSSTCGLRYIAPAQNEQKSGSAGHLQVCITQYIY
jgi:hypothetical protein